MKAIKQWFKVMPKKYSILALQNHKGYKGFGYAKTLEIALMLGFDWYSSPEGGEFWERVFVYCKTGEWPLEEPKPNKVTKSIPKINKKISVKSRSITKKKHKPKIKRTYKPKLKKKQNGDRLLKPKKEIVKEYTELESKYITEYSSVDKALERLFKNKNK